MVLLLVACGHTDEKPATSSSPSTPPTADLGDSADSSAGHGAPADAEARSGVVGTWHEEFESAEAQVRYAGDTTYREDGTFEVGGKLNFQGEGMEVMGRGTYRIDRGLICHTFNEGTGPMEEQVGKELCEQLLEVSPTTIRYRNHIDQKVTELTSVMGEG